MPHATKLEFHAKKVTREVPSNLLPKLGSRHLKGIHLLNQFNLVSRISRPASSYSVKSSQMSLPPTGAYLKSAADGVLILIVLQYNCNSLFARLVRAQ